MQTDVIYNMDALEALRSLPDESVHCCVTSPPYYAPGLRRGGTDRAGKYAQRVCCASDRGVCRSPARSVFGRDAVLNISDTFAGKAIRVMRWTRSIPTAGPVRPWH